MFLFGLLLANFISAGYLFIDVRYNLRIRAYTLKKLELFILTKSECICGRKCHKVPSTSVPQTAFMRLLLFLFLIGASVPAIAEF